MAGAITYKELNLNDLDYGLEVITNKNTGAKSVNVSTVKGSTDRAHKIRFQMGVYDQNEFLRAPFGVSKPMERQENHTRRDLDLSIDSDELLAFLRQLDERNLQAASDHSVDWFKKPMEKAVLRDRFKQCVREPAKAEYRPTVRTKIVVDAERNNTQIFVVTKETPAFGDQPARMEEYVPGTMQDITKGSKVIAIVETNGLWMGANQFGMSLNVTHLLVWPTQSRGIEAFCLNAHPKPAQAPSGFYSPTMGGMYNNAIDDMIND